MVRFVDLFSRCIQLKSTNMFSNVFETVGTKSITDHTWHMGVALRP